MTDLGWPELLIVAAIAMLLFGTKKMPDVARSIGRSMRIVKAELSGLHDEPAATAAPSGAESGSPPAAPAAGPAVAPAGVVQPEPVAEPARPVDPPTR